MLENTFHVVNVILVIGQIHAYELNLTRCKLYFVSRMEVVTVLLGLVKVYFALMEVWQDEDLLANVKGSLILLVANVDQSMIVIIIQRHVIVDFLVIAQGQEVGKEIKGLIFFKSSRAFAFIPQNIVSYFDHVIRIVHVAILEFVAVVYQSTN